MENVVALYALARRYGADTEVMARREAEANRVLKAARGNQRLGGRCSICEPSAP